MLYLVDHHYPMRFSKIFHPNGKQQRRKERFDPFYDALEKAYTDLELGSR
jgi:hypothetical protein